MTYLGIDIGTSEVKAILTDDAQTIIASAGVTLRVSSPHPGWSEQNPEDWWHATLDVIAAIRAAQPVAFSGLRGIGLSGQMHGATLLDKQQHVLRAAILWNDTRAFAECVELEAWCPSRAPSRATSHARPHGAQAAVAAKIRAIAVPRHGQGLAAQGLRGPASDGRVCFRHVRRFRHPVAGRGQTRLVGAHAGRHRFDARAHAAPGRRQRRRRAGAALAVPGVGHRAPGAAGRRRGRQCGGGCRPGRGGPGAACCRWGVRRAVCRQRRLWPNPGQACTRSATACPNAGTR